MKVIVNRSVCSSLGMCEAAAPEHFEVTDNGELRILNDAPDAAERAVVEDAVAACPTGALSIED